MEPDNKNIEDLLIDYALGEIGPEDKVRVELMLAEDPGLMREARALKRMVSHMGVSMVMPPPRVAGRVRHAAYEAASRRGGWRRLVWSALRRPVTAAAAGLVVVALLVALIGPSLWHGPGRKPPTYPVGSAGTIAPDLKAFLEDNVRRLDALQHGEALDPEAFSPVAGNAMLLAEKADVPAAQRDLLLDIAAVWKHGHERFYAVGYLSDEIIVELKGLAAGKQLVERIEKLLDESDGGR